MSNGLSPHSFSLQMKIRYDTQVKVTSQAALTKKVEYLMARTLKAALGKSNPEESSFWARMRSTVERSGGFSHKSPQEIERVLSFFKPEWEARDGRFFPRLDEFTSDSWGVEFITANYKALSQHVGPVAISTIANDHELVLPFRSAMQLLLTLAGYGFVERVAPYAKPSSLPVYNVRIDHTGLLFFLAVENKFIRETDVDFMKSLFKPELDGGHFGFIFDVLRAVGMAEEVNPGPIRARMIENQGVGVSPAQMERLLGASKPPRASITKVLVSLCQSDQTFRRVPPFIRPDGCMPQMHFAYVPNVDHQLPDQSSAALETMIEKVIRSVLQDILLHPDVRQMSDLRALVKHKGWPEDDLVETIKAKINKKRLPKNT